MLVVYFYQIDIILRLSWISLITYLLDYTNHMSFYTILQTKKDNRDYLCTHKCYRNWEKLLLHLDDRRNL